MRSFRLSLVVPFLFFCCITLNVQAKDLSPKLSKKIIVSLKEETLSLPVLIPAEVLERIAEISGAMSFADVVDQVMAQRDLTLVLGEMCLEDLGKSDILPPFLKDCMDAHQMTDISAKDMKGSGEKTLTELIDKNDKVSVWGSAGIIVSFGGDIDLEVGGGFGDKVGDGGGTVSTSDIKAVLDSLDGILGGDNKGNNSGKKDGAVSVSSDKGSKSGTNSGPENGGGNTGSKDQTLGKNDKGSSGNTGNQASGGDAPASEGNAPESGGSGGSGDNEPTKSDKTGTPACHVDGGDCGGSIPAEVACHSEEYTKKFFGDRPIEAKKKKDPIDPPQDGGGGEDCLAAKVTVTADEVRCRRDRITNPGEGNTTCKNHDLVITLASPMTAEVLLTLQIPLINPGPLVDSRLSPTGRNNFGTRSSGK